jgi:hypothetical protein
MTNSEKTGRILTVIRARMASTPVAKSPQAANWAKLTGRFGPITPGRRKTNPKKRKL